MAVANRRSLDRHLELEAKIKLYSLDSLFIFFSRIYAIQAETMSLALELDVVQTPKYVILDTGTSSSALLMKRSQVLEINACIFNKGRYGNGRCLGFDFAAES